MWNFPLVTTGDQFRQVQETLRGKSRKPLLAGNRIGEIIGVGLFAGIWALITSRVAIRERRVPVWIGWIGLVAGIALISPVVELLGIEIDGLVTVTTSLVHLWWLIMGIAILARSAEADRVDYAAAPDSSDPDGEPHRPTEIR